MVAAIKFIRDTPLLVQLFFLYYVLPDYGITLPAFLTGALALGLQYSAYTSEDCGAGDARSDLLRPD
jgi:polar amino acid transport system permease protein